MTRPLKVNGLVELGRLTRRLKHQFALQRIGEDDFKYLLQRTKELEARIVVMREEDETGEEVNVGGE
jgi:hypothetical protein